MRQDTWAEGDKYEHYVGRWSRPVADAFLEWVACSPRYGWLDVGCGTGALTLIQDAGLEQVEGRNIDVSTKFKDFDDYWTPFLGGQGPAPGYAMGLNDSDREALRDVLKQSLPIESDGNISLIARALAVKGVRRQA